MVTVSDRMSTDVAAVRPDTTLVEAAQQMRSSGVGGIPVLDHQSECAGILTERDIVVRVLAEEREPLAAFVRDVASMHPVICSPRRTSLWWRNGCVRTRSSTCRFARRVRWSA